LITEVSKVKLIDLSSLWEALKDSFDSAEFQALCSLLNVDYDDLLEQECAGKMRELIFYLRRRARLAELIVRLRELRPSIAWETMVEEVTAQEETAVVHTHPIPFTSRDKESQLIQSPLSPAYFILDAPSGFGKTALLQQLHAHFRDHGWLSAYAAIDSHSTLPDLVKALADDLAVTPLLAQDHDSRPWGMRFGAALQNHWDELNKEGLVLLIDLDERAPHTIAAELIDSFIPQVQSCMRALRFFARKHNRFRIVLAGRKLAPPPKTKVPIPLAILSLPPFSFDMVRETTRHYLEHLAEETLDQLSAHVFHLTGGHPGSVAQVLAMFRRYGGTPDFFVAHYALRVWQEALRPAVDELAVSLGSHYNILSELSVLRSLNYAVFPQLLDETHFSATPLNAIALADELTTAYLLNRDGRFLKDSQTRRLFVIQRYHQDPQTFARRCQHAQAICAAELSKDKVQAPEVWMIEYLFQYLQQHAYAPDAAQRRKIRDDFFTVQAPTALRLFAETHSVRHPREKYEALRQQLDADWEFQFAINYYLRDEQFADANAYGRLQQQISGHFFAQTKSSDF
jgi:hypothetical protein